MTAYSLQESWCPVSIEALCESFIATFRIRIRTVIRATSHLSVRLTSMHMFGNEVSSHLCQILTLIIV